MATDEPTVIPNDSEPQGIVEDMATYLERQHTLERTVLERSQIKQKLRFYREIAGLPEDDKNVQAHVQMEILLDEDYAGDTEAYEAQRKVMKTKWDMDL